jgi:hypothetical protein
MQHRGMYRGVAVHFTSLHAPYGATASCGCRRPERESFRASRGRWKARDQATCDSTWSHCHEPPPDSDPGMLALLRDASMAAGAPPVTRQRPGRWKTDWSATAESARGLTALGSLRQGAAHSPLTTDN